MDFGQAINVYFTTVLDFVMYFAYFFFAAGLVILDWPKSKEWKDFLFAIIKGVAVYIVYVFHSMLMFAISMVFFPGPNIGGLFFTATFIIIPILYVFIFLKEDVLHKLIKILVIAATYLILSEIGRISGIIVGKHVESGNISIYIVRSVVYIFVPFVSFVIYKFDIKRFKKLPVTNVVILIVLALSLIFAAVWVHTIEFDKDHEYYLIIFMSITSLFVLVTIYYSIYYMIDSRHKITTLEVHSALIQLEKESLLMDEQNREELSKIRHDLKNQLSYVHVLIQDNKIDEANKYLDDLLEQKEEYLDSFSCSNLTISAIINLELSKAKIANKKLKAKAVVPPQLPFSESDLLSLITNVVDNAIENFKPADEADYVGVTIVTQKDYLRITVINTVDESMVQSATKLKTTKNARKHGYGTRIIKNIVTKYDGYVTFSIENENKFVCDILLDLNNKVNANEED